MSRRFSVYLQDEETVNQIERLVDMGRYRSFSHLFSDAVKEKIEEEGVDNVYR